MNRDKFLPVNREDMEQRGWRELDFLMVTGDAYIDHPSFGAAVIARTLEAMGYRVGIIAQPNISDKKSLDIMGRPKLAVLVTGGNIDSMVSNYTAAKRRRSDDAYSPSNKAGKRPDRALSVYCKMAKKQFPDIPVIAGGLEGSLRRFAHYDYWDDKVRPPILADCGADILVFGMGERPIKEIANRLAGGEAPSYITDIRGTCVLVDSKDKMPSNTLMLPSYEEVSTSKTAYAKAARLQHDEQDHIWGKPLAQRVDNKYMLQNRPSEPQIRAELDEVFDLPYARNYHPDYEKEGGVPAIAEVKFSIIHNRGCFGGCNFCSITFHQGRFVTSRSHQSVIKEASEITGMPDFKGYIHDVGGPTANFRSPSCQKQKDKGLCKGKNCLAPTPCPSLNISHTDYLELLKKLRALPKVKKVFIRSGLRFDYLIYDKDRRFLRQLVEHHISGQLKVAPEHVAPSALKMMGKPQNFVYEQFCHEYQKLNTEYGKKQYIVPYLMSSHPGCTLKDAVQLAEYLRDNRITPQQVQDFYPTPGTLSTAMFYTGLDPVTMKPVYVPKSAGEKSMQRALIQYKNPKNRALVIEALKQAGRTDLIGFGPKCLIRPLSRSGFGNMQYSNANKPRTSTQKSGEQSKIQSKGQSKSRKKK